MYTFDAVKATNNCVKWIQNWFEENGRGCNAVVGISGGKDSTVVAALCAKALGPERVIGVMLPNGTQTDINDSREIIKNLGIVGCSMNIASAYRDMIRELDDIKFSTADTDLRPVITRQARENLPPRLRMTALYMAAQCWNGRVSNNCNLSENWIGYSTIYGDTAGDFSAISSFTVSEVIEIGRVLNIPEKFLIKPPADGLCGQTDEDKLGFTYAVLDRYLRTGEIDDPEIKERIDVMHKMNRFKHEPIKSFEWKTKTNGSFIGGAFWDETEFGKFNEQSLRELQDEGMHHYNVLMTKDGELAIWAHDEAEAKRIGERLTLSEINTYGYFDLPYVTGSVKLDW